jgi:hypothetical protein
MSVAEAEIRGVEVDINYLLPDGPKINRRFAAPGVEVNTGVYAPYRMTVRDARPNAGQFSLDRHGFQLFPHKSAVGNFFDNDEVGRLYPAEVSDAIKQFTGATFVAVMGWMVRTSDDLAKYKRQAAGYAHQGGVQPPAGEAHVDTIPEKALPQAQALYKHLRRDGPGFHRFIYSSFWRTFSEPPQDWPLAVCEWGSVGADEGVPNVLVICDRIPEGEALFAPIQDEHAKPTAAIFHHNPNHRWWYFSNMTRDEVLLIKFHDSDQSRAWRVPHTAFHDPTFPNANPRASIEVRSVAFFE